MLKSFLILSIISFVYSVPLKQECNNIESCLKEKFSSLNKPTTKQLCDACYLGMPLARELIRKNDTKYFKEIATFVCTFLNITQEQICAGAINLFTNPVLSIINDTTLSDIELCSVGIGCGPVNNPILNWNITLPNVPKPPVFKPNTPSPSSPKIRILQISDLHIDFEYQPGSLADCGQPLCCRNTSNFLNQKLSNNRKAGFWGDYRNCDVPIWTVENMFEYIANKEQFDFIYWTGDLPPHNVWNQSKRDQLNALDILTDLFKKYFPNKVVYPTLGNHESSPVNLFPTPFVKEDNITWLYERAAQDWTQTGLPDYLKPSITLGGFYTVPLCSGLRLVSLNMNYCHDGNYYLYINSTDPLNQLAWFANVLQESENKGEKVHIIGHVHPDSCLTSFSNNYYKIVNRYESTITGQFYGHSHSDELRIFYDLNNITRPISVTYISGSVTTYSNLNPNYRIFTIDGNYDNSSYQVLDHETYFMNLTDANLSMKPIWQKEYSAKEAFNLTSLLPDDWNTLLNNMLDDLNGPLTDQIYKYYSKSADTRKDCNLACRKNLICGFKQARSDNFIPC